MGELKLEYFERTESPEQKDYVKLHNHCILCGTVLKLQHIRLVETPSIREEAFCPTCDLKTRAKNHILH